MQKKITVAALIAMMGMGVLVLNTSVAHAQTTSNPVMGMVESLAKKFGLKTSDVQSVFDQQRQERMEARKAEHLAWLDQQVSAGKLTKSQRDAIATKLGELQTKREAERVQLQEWATANDVDLTFLRGGMGLGRGKGMMHGW
jgi:molybdopterin biosynthesis enzyme MoaB